MFPVAIFILKRYLCDSEIPIHSRRSDFGSYPPILHIGGILALVQGVSFLMTIPNGGCMHHSLAGDSL